MDFKIHETTVLNVRLNMKKVGTRLDICSSLPNQSDVKINELWGLFLVCGLSVSEGFAASLIPVISGTETGISYENRKGRR